MNAGLHTRAALGSDRYPHSAVKGAHPQTAAVKDNDKGGADVTWEVGLRLPRWKS